MLNDSAWTAGQKDARKRKANIAGIFGFFIFLFGLPPLMNSLSNPRLATLHGADVIRLVAVGWCFGIGVTLLFISLIFRGK